MGNEGTSFEIDLPVKGADKVDAAANSLDVLAARMAATKESYSQAEKAANLAAKAVERIGVAIEAQKGKLATATEIGNSASAAKAEKTIAALANRQGEAATKAAHLKGALDAQAGALDAVTKDYEKAKKAAEGASGAQGPAYETISRGLKKLGGPLAEIGEKVARVGSGFDKLKKGFGSGTGLAIGMTVAAVALAAALLAAAAAAGVMIVQTAAWGVTLADAHRESVLLAQGMTQSVKGGEQLADDVKRLSGILPLTTDQLSEMARGFAYSGYRGKDLTNALEQSAVWAARLKFGPNFQAEMLGLSEQAKVFKLNLSNAFGGLKIEGLLEGLQKLVALFDVTTASGRAIKTIFEAIFQPLVDKAADASTAIEAFFLHLEILTLKALIFFKPWASTLFTIGEAAVLTLGGLVVGAIAAVTAALAPMALAVLAATWPFLAIGAAVGLLVFAGIELVRHWEQVKTFFSGLGATMVAFGRDLILGLVDGVKDAAGAVVEAVTGAVGGAIKAAKKLLGIASPSKVFAEIGVQTGAGMALGVDRSSDHVSDAFEDMVTPPDSAAGSAGRSGAGAARGGVHLENVQFVFHGVKGAEQAQASFADALTRLLEGDAAQLGGMEPA